MNVNIVEKANIIVRESKFAYIGFVDEEGFPMVSAISTVQPENFRELYFTTGMRSKKAECFLHNSKASVCFRHEYNNITLIGEIENHTDQETKSRFWKDFYIEFFPKGETDPDYCVLKFITKRVILWIENEAAVFTVEELMTAQSRCGDVQGVGGENL